MLLPVYHRELQNANVYSENLFEIYIDKQMFWMYDTAMQTVVRNICSGIGL